jgi:prepilin peptidase CpaA
LFFPEPVFAWVFCVSLIVFLGLAAWTDTCRARIPNRLTILLLALGLLMNAVRGGLMAADEKPLWVFETTAPWLGAIDGLLFALAGFLVAFAVMFGLWVLGMVGGGDVKLMAAVAAWLGLTKILFLVWLGSILALFVWAGGRVLLSGGLTPRKLKRTMEEARKPKAVAGPPGKNTPFRMTYSLPIAVAAAVVLLWMFRFELQWVPPRPQPEQHQGKLAHASPPRNPG